MMVDTLTGVLDTTGFIDSVTIEGDRLRIAGWSAAFDGSPIDGIVVSWQGEPLTPIDLRTALPSADVIAVYPQLPTGASCRFELVAQAPAQQRDILLAVLPTSGGRPGRRMFHLLEPALPEPPQEHIVAIGGSFLSVSLEMLDHFIERGRLQPDERVLDVGCGVGRIAYGLAYYLNANGRYDGFDVIPALVEWATAHIAAARPHFRFQHVNIYNRMYNSGGVLRADTFTFPYPDASFDFVTLTSVFTHIPSKEVRHYFDEIARVLAPGGRVVATAFVMDDEVRSLIKAGRSTLPLVHPYRGGYVSDLAVPEGAVGYDEPVLRRWIEESGLRVASLFPGSWCGRARGLSYQDLLVLEPGDSSARLARRADAGNPFARWLGRLGFFDR